MKGGSHYKLNGSGIHDQVFKHALSIAKFLFPKAADGVDQLMSLLPRSLKGKGKGAKGTKKVRFIKHTK